MGIGVNDKIKILDKTAKDNIFTVRIDKPESSEIPVDVPTKTSDLINDSGFITIEDIPGGGGGVTDYEDLTSKPSINDNELIGNKTADQLNLQDKLVSGTNLKTINNQSLLGSGNISIQSGVTGVKGDSEISYRTGNVNLTPANVGAAPTNHASSNTTYGIGMSSYFGHVKLSDSTESSSDSRSGFAATPKAVKNALDTAKEYTDNLDIGVTDVTVGDSSVVSGGIADIKSGTAAQLTTGTDTENRVWQAKIIHDYVASIAGGADAMRFKGTVGTGGDVTTLPTTGVQIGDTYMVNTAGTYAWQTCEVGDLIIATATTPTWTVAQTNIDGAITSLSGTSPISVTGSGTSRTVSINAASGSAAGSMSSAHYTKLEGIEAGAQVNRTYTSTTGKPTSNQTPGFGSTFTISQISQGTTGQIMATDRTVKIPDTVATNSAAGLMSAQDKSDLDNAVAVLGDFTITSAYLAAGNTSVSINADTLYSYTAIMDDEEVILDVTETQSGYTFSIASPVSDPIVIAIIKA